MYDGCEGAGLVAGGVDWLIMAGVGMLEGWLEVMRRGLVATWLFFMTNSNSEDSLEPLPSCFGGPAPGCSCTCVTDISQYYF